MTPSARILRLNLDGSGRTILARGMRNTVGFDWRPGSGELYWTDNGRDELGDDVPPDELNRIPAGSGTAPRRRTSASHTGTARTSPIRTTSTASRRTALRAGAGTRRACGGHGHALLQRQDVPRQIPGRDLHRPARQLEPQPEGGLPRDVRQARPGRSGRRATSLSSPAGCSPARRSGAARPTSCPCPTAACSSATTSAALYIG